MATIPILRESTPTPTPMWHAVSACERAAAFALFAAASPILAGSAFAMWRLSGRSTWIAHRRVGLGGDVLWMFKLRTMWSVADGARSKRTGWVEYIHDDPGAEGKRAGDPRIGHWLAGFCRRHSIDELPQLWHVIRGEMALIGPRPMTASELRRYYGPDAAEVLAVKPGMAGLWQTSGRNRLTYSERRELDLQFVRRRSPGMYARILLRTLPEIWKGSNSW